jgi:hypothetical protein
MVATLVYSEGLLWFKRPNIDAIILTVSIAVYNMVEHIIDDDNASQHYKAICFDTVDLLYGTTISAHLLDMDNAHIPVTYPINSYQYDLIYKLLKTIKQLEPVSPPTSSCQIFIFSQLIDGFND